MAITLIIEGRELRQEQPEPFCMSDRDAARARQAAQAARQRDRAQGRHTRALDAAATAEARVRPLTRDPLVLMLQRGHLRDEQVRAGQEILRVYTAISAGITAKVTTSYWERVAGGPPQEDWPPALRRAYRERYAPWRDWAGAIGVAGASTLADLTMLVAVDGYGPVQVAGRLGLHHLTTRRLLQRSLWWYALHAGWARPHPEVMIKAA